MSERYQTYEISKFVRRQTRESEFSHWLHTDKELIDLVVQAVIDGKALPGYRDGVLRVVVNPAGFFSALVQLQEGDQLEGEFKARQPGETPRKSSYSTCRSKLAAQYVEVILYRHDVLAENNEQSCDADWEIISVNASPSEDGNLPIPTGACLANHYRLNGGTATDPDDDPEFVGRMLEQLDKDLATMQPGTADDFELSYLTVKRLRQQLAFVKQLGESVKFYADKAHCAPADRATRDEVFQMLDDLSGIILRGDGGPSGDENGVLEKAEKAKAMVEAEYQRRVGHKYRD